MIPYAHWIMMSAHRENRIDAGHGRGKALISPSKTLASRAARTRYPDISSARRAWPAPRRIHCGLCVPQDLSGVETA